MEVAYTIGQKALYDEHLRSQEEFRKSPGGSVWKTLELARAYLESIGSNVSVQGDRIEADVYGVVLDGTWETDVEQIAGTVWGALKVPSRIVTLDVAEGHREATRIRRSASSRPPEETHVDMPELEEIEELPPQPPGNPAS